MTQKQAVFVLISRKIQRNQRFRLSEHSVGVIYKMLLLQIFKLDFPLKYAIL
jgi:hypothetical protein